MPEEPFTARDRRTAVLALLGTVALVVAATWYVVLRPPGPSVPHGRGHLELAPAAARPGAELRAYADEPIHRGATGTLFVDRWDGHHWADTRVLANGEWSSPIGEDQQVGVAYTDDDEPVTSWSFTLPLGMPAGAYLVCDLDRDCGLLDID